MTIGNVDTQIDFSEVTSAEERRICRLYERMGVSALLAGSRAAAGTAIARGRIPIVVVNLYNLL